MAKAQADALERFIHLNFWLRRQQRVQQTRLVSPEAQTPLCLRAEASLRAAQSVPATLPAIGRRSHPPERPWCPHAVTPRATVAGSPSHRRSPLRPLSRTSRFPSSRPRGSSRLTERLALGLHVPTRSEAARAPRGASSSSAAAMAIYPVGLREFGCLRSTGLSPRLMERLPRGLLRVDVAGQIDTSCSGPRFRDGAGVSSIQPRP